MASLLSAASMRPRHFCRGRSAGGFAGWAWLCAASMRPRHFCRGRCPPLPRCPGANRRFNEAPAFLPGKMGWAARYWPEFDKASMRPRHFCRGRCFSQNSEKKQSDKPIPASAQRLRQVPPGKFIDSQRWDDRKLLIYIFKQQCEHSRIFYHHLSARADRQSVAFRHEAIHTIRVRRSTGSKALPRLDTLGLTSSAGPRSRNRT